MEKKYIVSMAVDGRIDVPVTAESPEAAFEKAKEAFTDADLAQMETVDAKPVNAYDPETETYTDYN